MTDDLINPDVYAELADATGADFASELVTTFLDEAPKMLKDLRTAAEDRDADSYRRAAHSIKSNAETFGAVQLATRARDMELTGLPDDVAPVSALEATFAETAPALKALTDG